jgi:hypothetical protein
MAYHSDIQSLFHVTLGFRRQLAGTPQAHFLQQEVSEYNSENFKLNFYFPLHLCT